MAIPSHGAAKAKPVQPESFVSNASFYQMLANVGVRHIKLDRNFGMVCTPMDLCTAKIYLFHDSAFGNAYNDIGIMLQEKGRHSEAIEFFQKASWTIRNANSTRQFPHLVRSRCCCFCCCCCCCCSSCRCCCKCCC